MSFTRFHDDPCRIAKQLQESSDVGRYILNVPGNGLTPTYMEDPYIRLQKWGGNLRTNVLEIEESLRGLNRKLNRDCLEENNFKNFTPNSSSINVPTHGMFTEQSRAIMPAWNIRGIDTLSFPYLHNDPQASTQVDLNINMQSRITEIDNFNNENNILTH